MAGKGDKRRPSSIPPSEWGERFDEIFRKKKPVAKPVKKDCSETNKPS